MEHTAKRDRRFLVGYPHGPSLVWGRQPSGDYLQLMDKDEAQAAQKALPTPGATIYEITEYTPGFLED